MVFSFGHKKRGQRADAGRKALNFLRQTKRVPADPKTKLGRKKLTAQSVLNDAKRDLHKRK